MSDYENVRFHTEEALTEPYLDTKDKLDFLRGIYGNCEDHGHSHDMSDDGMFDKCIICGHVDVGKVVNAILQNADAISNATVRGKGNYTIVPSGFPLNFLGS